MHLLLTNQKLEIFLLMIYLFSTQNRTQQGKKVARRL